MRPCRLCRSAAGRAAARGIFTESGLERAYTRYQTRSTFADFPTLRNSGRLQGPQSVFDSITFGITTFERPRHLERLVASILRQYPLARIVVADNGRQRAKLPKSVRVLELPFDCGLSRSRNALIDVLETPYLLVLDDDWRFTEESDIRRMLAILEHDPEVGVVGGAVRGAEGRISAYSLDIEVFRGTLFVRDSVHRVRVTPTGVPYRLCDVVWNFALFRREMLADHRWDDRLKLGEHAPYFHQVKLAARWRVACCPSVVVDHDTGERSRDYRRYRQRAREFFEGYLQRNGLDDYHRFQPWRFEDDPEDRPCVVLLGVGHSGTSVAAKMFHAAGWEPGDADDAFGESVSVRELNQHVEQRGQLPSTPAMAALEALPRPWAIKDPRFVTTLHHWLPHFARLERPPLLVRIVRDLDRVIASHHRRNAPGDVPHTLEQRMRSCVRQYQLWPWSRMTIQYERLGLATGLFSPSAANGGAGGGTPLGSLAATPLPAADDPAQRPARGRSDGSTLNAMRAWDGSSLETAWHWDGSGDVSFVDDHETRTVDDGSQDLRNHGE